MEPKPKKRKYNKLYCPHCELEVSKSTWYVHHSQFYDQVNKTWLKDVRRTTEADQDFNFGSSDENDDNERLSNFFDEYEDPELPMNTLLTPTIDQVFRINLSLYLPSLGTTKLLRTLIISVLSLVQAGPGTKRLLVLVSFISVFVLVISHIPKLP